MSSKNNLKINIDWVERLKEYHEFLQWDDDYFHTDELYENMSQNDAKKQLKEDLEFIIGSNGKSELFDSEIELCKELDIELGD